MPLKPLSYREIKRKLEAAGFEVVSQKGSHVKFAGSIGHQVKNVHLCYIMDANKNTPTSRNILTVGAQGLRPFFLCQKLKAAGAPENLIETVHGRGYRLREAS